MTDASVVNAATKLESTRERTIKCLPKDLPIAELNVRKIFSQREFRDRPLVFILKNISGRDNVYQGKYWNMEKVSL